MISANRSLTCAAALILLSTACSGDAEQALLGNARNSIEKHDLAAASIDLRSVLQKNPDSAQARYLFGRLLLESGNAQQAEIELRKAQELKYSVDEVAPLLARALIERQQYSSILSDFAALKLTNPEKQADLTAIVASAYASTGKLNEAKALIDSAAESAPDNPSVRMVQARIAAANGDVEGALRILDTAVGTGKGSFDIWRLEGDLLFYGKSDGQGAYTAYEKALKIRPGDVYTRSQLITIDLRRGDLKAAERSYGELAKAHPGNFQTKFIGANIAMLKGDYARARDLATQLLRQTKDNPSLLLLIGAAELKLNSLGEAERHAGMALASDPKSAAARRLLAAVHLRMGQPDKALEKLRPLLEGTAPDPEAMTLAAEAYLQDGDLKKSESFFARVAKERPGDVKARTALALAKIGSGSADAGLAELQSIAASDKGTLADMALIDARMRRRDFDGAQRAVDALERKIPDKPLPADIRGRIYLLMRDNAKARASFEAAVSRDPAYFASIAMLARLDVAENKPAAAQQRLEAFLKADPRNAAALVALADVRSTMGAAADEVTQILARAVSANPTDVAARLLLVQSWLGRNNAKQAIVVAQDGLATAPDEPRLLDALGAAQLADGAISQSLNTFGKLATLQPRSALTQLRLADANLRAGNMQAAESALRKALDISPELPGAQRWLISLAVRAKQPEKALLVARSIQKQRPGDVTGYLFEGDAQAAFKDWDSAVRAYRAGLSKRGGGEAALRLRAVLIDAKRQSEADKFAAEWIKQHPREVQLRSQMALEAMRGEEFSLAERRYREIVDLQPRNVTAINNLAWVMAKQKNEGAVAMARRALAIAPDNAMVLDTLAFALGEAGQLPDAIDAARRAVSLAPHVANFRFTLAKLYVKSGDKDHARPELDALAKLGDRFAGHQEVSDLRKGL